MSIWVCGVHLEGMSTTTTTHTERQVPAGLEPAVWQMIRLAAGQKAAELGPMHPEHVELVARILRHSDK